MFLLDQKPDKNPNKKLKRKFQLNIGHALKIFCENSSINGIRYIPEAHRHWLEKIWWILAIILSIYLCSSTIYGLKQKWNESPVIISYNAKLLSIGTIPFPAMTVCPATRISARKFNFTKTYRSLFKLDGQDTPNITDREIKQLKVAGQLCNELFSINLLDYFQENVTDDSIFDVIKEISTSFDDTLVACSFLAKYSTCYRYFHEIFTEEGTCYTFNLLTRDEIFRKDDGLVSHEDLEPIQNRSSKHWNFKTGYEYKYKRSNDDEYPFRTFRTGTNFGFHVILKILHENVDKLCDGALNGFRVTFHTPYEFPYFTQLQYYISPKRSVDFLITPKVILPSTGLHTYDPNERQCYFPYERRLKFFKIYTRDNCQLECAWNVTIIECGCVTLTMPREKNTELCGPAKIGCCVNAARNAHKKNISDFCNCMPQCRSISYDVSILDAEYNLNEVFDKTRLNGTMDMGNSTFNRIRVAFGTDSYRPIYRIELYTPSEFLANCGGLFGLFMGASLLSFIEIIYYFTLHGFCVPNSGHAIKKVKANGEKTEMKKNNKKKLMKILHSDLKTENVFHPFPYTP